MKSRQIGFTLIELMVVVALAAILASLAVPSFRVMFVKRTVQSAVDVLSADFRLARAEAIKRSAPTIVCRSDNGATCLDSSGSWSVGWIVFVDVNANNAVDAGDEIVKVQQALSGIESVQKDSSPLTTLYSFRYVAAGWARGAVGAPAIWGAANETFTFTPTGSDGATYKRLVCVSIIGRAGIRPSGATAC